MNEPHHTFANRKEAGADFLRTGREAWEEYQRTGRYITAKRAVDWLARLEAGELAPPPEPEPEDP